MPSSIPDAATMLTAAIKYFEDELLPELSGYHRFKTRVAVNVLNTIFRELTLSSSAGIEEHARLAKLLGEDGSNAVLNSDLARKIREGGVEIDNPELRSHIRESLREALAINNPRWLRGG